MCPFIPVILVANNSIIINYQVTYDFTMIQGAEPGQDPLAVLKVRTCQLRLHFLAIWHQTNLILVINLSLHSITDNVKASSNQLFKSSSLL